MVFVFLDEDSAFAAAQSRQLDIVRIPAAIAANAKNVKDMKLVERHSVENRGSLSLFLPQVKRCAR